MPKNRHTRSREDKSAEIVAIAQRLFVEQGYDGTTIAAIARETGVATNVVHWYFATKDELFVAVLDALQSDGLEAFVERRMAAVIQGEEKKELGILLARFVSHLVEMSGLIATVHERSPRSPVLSEFHKRAHRRYAEYLGRAVARCEVPDAEQALVVEALFTACEGLVLHRASRAKARRMMSFLVERLTTNDSIPKESHVLV